MTAGHGGGPGGTAAPRAVSHVRPEAPRRGRGAERPRAPETNPPGKPVGPGRSLGQLPLVRRVLGDVLRRTRLRQDRTLRQVSAAAMVSLGYLSEVERGQKEASSELLAAICAALDVPQSAVLREVSEELAVVESVPMISSSVRSPGNVVAAA